MDNSILHITNGDSAADLLTDAGIEGVILPWRDILHEGPVPATKNLSALSEVRARFIFNSGWGSFLTCFCLLSDMPYVFFCGVEARKIWQI